MGIRKLLKRMIAGAATPEPRPSQIDVPAIPAAPADVLDGLCAGATTPAQAAKVLDRVLREVVAPHHNSWFWGDRLLTLDKSAEFRDDPVFRAALTRADSSTGANQYESPDGIAWRYHTLIWAARTCLSLPGDFVECGVYRGDMTWMITENVDLKAAGKKFWLYDTFAGFDSKYSSDADFPDTPHVFEIIDRDYRVTGIEAAVRGAFSGQELRDRYKRRGAGRAGRSGARADRVHAYRHELAAGRNRSAGGAVRPRVCGRYPDLRRLRLEDFSEAERGGRRLHGKARPVYP